MNILNVLLGLIILCAAVTVAFNAQQVNPCDCNSDFRVGVIGPVKSYNCPIPRLGEICKTQPDSFWVEVLNIDNHFTEFLAVHGFPQLYNNYF